MIQKPIFFEKNRVFRVYTGGKLFDEFFEDGSEDGFYPEEWIASSVRAINREMKTEKDGVSVTEDGEYFDELLRRDPISMLGSSGKMRILVKILDSAIRLPAQAHPDREFSRTHLGSEYGKTESWIILGTRQDAKIYFGFIDGVDRESFEKAIDACETDRDAMERLMEYSVPTVGDVYLVPARTVHAIGAGCLILEVQEPTDFTIQPEHWCGDYKLNEKEMYLELSRETAVDCFDFGKTPDTRLTPRVVQDNCGFKKEILIDKSNTDCFVINRITLKDGEYKPSVFDSYGVYILTKGSGKLIGEGYERSIKKGDYFFMPACLMNSFTVIGELEMIECY